MENNKNIHDFLANNMNWKDAEIEAPGLSQLNAARNAVMARKKITLPKRNFLSEFFAFLNPDLKFYHLGVCVLLIMVGTFYITENHGNANGQGFSDQMSGTLSIKNSTISVNSNTMLTSIPTLRN